MTVEEVNKITGIPVKELNRLNRDLWYHGTSPDGSENIQDIGVEAFYNLGNMLDFGAGFYLTDTKERAENYISRVPVVTASGAVLKRKEWVIIEFKINPFEVLFGEGLPSRYKYVNFAKHNEEFARFAFDNRLNNVDNEKPHGIDIIWGVMSDNFPDQIIFKYIDGEISYEEAISRLQKPNSMKQLYIGNQEICNMLEITATFKGIASDKN